MALVTRDKEQQGTKHVGHMKLFIVQRAPVEGATRRRANMYGRGGKAYISDARHGNNRQLHVIKVGRKSKLNVENKNGIIKAVN